MKNFRAWLNTLIWIVIGAGVWYYAVRPIPAPVQNNEYYGPITTIEHAEIKITWMEDKPVPKMNYKIPDVKKIDIPPQ